MKYLFKFLITPLIILPFFVITKIFQLIIVIFLIIWDFNFKKEWLKKYMKPWFICYIIGDINSNTFKGMWESDNNNTYFDENGVPI